MKLNKYRLFPLLLLISLLIAIAAEILYFSDFENKLRTKRVNRLLSEKEEILEKSLNAMEPILARSEPHGSSSETNVFALARENEITILEYLDGRLLYWSDNNFEVPVSYDQSLYKSPIIFLQNGWFLARSVKVANETIVGLLRIRTDYGFENEIVRNGFVKDFRLPGNVGFSISPSASEYHVFSRNGEFLFSLLFPGEKGNTFLISVPIIFYTASLVLSSILILMLAGFIAGKGWPRIASAIPVLFFTALYFFILLTGKPTIFSELDLFSQYVFSYGFLLPSLGHLLLLSIFLSISSYAFYRHFPLKEFEEKNTPETFLIILSLLIVPALLFSVFNGVFKRLILESNISFETYRILELNILSVTAYTSVILLLTVPVFFLLKFFPCLQMIRKSTILSAVLLSSLVIAVFYANQPKGLFPFMIFYLVSVTTILTVIRRKTDYFNLTILFSLIFGIYSLYFIVVCSEKKTDENIKIQLISLSTANDPVAEQILLDTWPVIESDTVLKRLMNVDVFEKDDFDRISKYLLDTYFSDYLGNFKLNIVTCGSNEPLRIASENRMEENCFRFFNNRIKKDGHRLTGTEIYFIENQGGRSLYLGRLFFKRANGITNGLFIELFNDINIFQPGYSEILFDKNYYGFPRLKNYSFAKYINGEVVLKSGDFPYNNTDADYIDLEGDYRIFNSSGYRHILYRNGNITTVISRQRLVAGDFIISFAYLFTFIFVFLNLVLLIIRRPSIRRLRNLNFRQKLQLSFISVLLFSFVLIGIVAAYLSVSQFRTRHQENIKEKLNSVYNELVNHLSLEKRLTQSWRESGYSSLDELLIELSNIFNTDINMYGQDGFLIATSRPEIFNRDLKSTRMDDMARVNLKEKSEYMQKEKIGNLEYISAYVPFVNSEGTVLAYLNLPYFRIQSILTREITNLIVAVINFTLLLIVITTALAVFIGNRLTSPLSMLSKGLASVELGKKNEHLVYKGNDEIGELVKQYNSMVDEIQESAGKLANSEREYAWREMARQIAHEIKNPLTPMKLNVQQLLKSWKDGIPDFGKRLETFTANQIEYIDNLSSIAGAFSSFAKLPGNNPVEVDLLEQIRSTLELFKNTDNIRFDVVWPHESKVIIFADREHLNGIFSNLFKNGIQSIPPGMEGVIKVISEVKGDKVIVAVSDNGAGIPEEIRTKMFTPNFTTKSSGMGLGLSIVKRYVENAGGRIWFESNTGKGTVFFIEFPLKYTVENNKHHE
jgi:signal transduction histidine kinase